MENAIIRFRAKGQNLSLVSGYNRFAGNTIGYIRIEIEPDDEWLDFDSVDALFQNEQGRVSAVLFYDSGVYACNAPVEMTAASSVVFLNLSGKNVVNNVLVERLTTYPVFAFAIDRSANVTSYRETEVSANMYEQYIAAVGDQVEKITDLTVSAHEADEPEVIKTATPGLPINLDFGLVRGETGEQGIPGEPGSQGEPGVPGEKGDPFTYDDFTEEQLAALVGPQGPRGLTGSAAGFGTVSATVDNNEGDPSVTVATSGPSTAKNINFEFKNLKGEKGDPGEQGDPFTYDDFTPEQLASLKGDTGATPNLSIGTVETLPPTGSSEVTITGTAENPVLNFKLVKGEQGEVSQAQLDAVVSDLKSELDDADYFLAIATESDFTLDGQLYVNYETGARQGSENWTFCVIPNREGFRKIRATAASANSANAAIIAFFNSYDVFNNTTYMGSSYAVKAIDGTHTYVANVPEGCKAIGVSTRAANFSNVSITIYSDENLGELLNTLDEVSISSQFTCETLNSFLNVKDLTDFTDAGNAYQIYTTGASQGSDNWERYSIVNEGYRSIQVVAGSAGNVDGAIIAFYSSTTVFNAETYMGSSYAVKAINGVHVYTADVPSECEAIVVSNRYATFDELAVILTPSVTISDFATKEEVVEIDDTLTETGKAADAKSTGDAIASLVTSIDNLESMTIPFPVSPESKFGTSGQILQTLGDGTTKWINQITPTDSQVGDAVADWLTEHPDATTTVQDGSITEAKLATALKKKTINCYLTPEEYGAVGDGSTDDTVAIQAAINAASALTYGGIVQFGNKAYKCEGLAPKNNVTLRGTNGTVLALPQTPTNHLIYYSSDTVLKNFNIENIRFDGRGQTSYDIIHIEKITDVVAYIWDESYLDKCWFLQAKTGVYCTVPGNVKISNCILQSNNVGLDQKYEHFHIVNTTFWGNRIGAHIRKANHFTWVNVVFAHNTECGVYSTEGSFESCLCACSFIDNVIHFHAPVHAYRFIGCRFINAQKGLYLDGTPAVFNNLIVGCYFSALTDTAINISNDSSYLNTISNCMFVGNQKDIEMHGTDESITGNTFVVTNTIAIDIAGASSSGLQIQNNHIFNASASALNTYPAIRLASPALLAVLISNNLIKNDGSGKASYAINMDNTDITFTSLADIMIANNVCRNMKTSGYRLSGNSESITTVNNIGTITTF